MSLSTSRVGRRIAALTLTGALVLVAGGCWNPFQPPVLGRGVSEPPPAPNTVSNTLRLLEWCYKNRSYSEYRELFTADYRFVFAIRDTAGNNYSGDTPWTRDDELESTRKLFEGGDPSQPAATSIALQLDKAFLVLNDPRPGKNNPLQRKSVTTQVNLTITTSDGASTNVFGSVTFYLVRGDSADIPRDLGIEPDANRWFIERWEDNTNGSNLAYALSPPTAGLRAAATLAAPRPAPAGAPQHSVPAVPALLRGARPGATPADDLPYRATWGAVKAWYR